jgi:hypothetical protein
VENKFHDIIELLKNGDAKAAWHKLGEHLHGEQDGGGVQPQGGPTIPPVKPTPKP